MKKLFCRISGVNAVLLFVYGFIVLFADSIAGSNVSLESPLFVFFLDCLNSILIISVVLCLICPIILRFFGGLSLNNDCFSLNSKSKALRFLLIFAVAFIPLLLFYLIYYPGGFSADSFNQYEQVISGNYNDWHPVLQTLLSFALPLTVTGGWIGSIVLFQIIAFALVIAYAVYSILVYTNKWYALASLLFILANPCTLNIALYPWKDTVFSILSLLLLTFALHIVFTKGEWIKKPVNMLAFLVAAVVETVVRHNAILFTLPLLIAVFFIISRKRAIVIMVGFVVLFAGITGPLYTALDVEEPDKRQTEILGLPMTVIGAVVKYDNEALDEETRQFAQDIASQEVWDLYSYGDFNSVKFASSKVSDKIEEYGTSKVLSVMLRCIKASPITALKGLVCLTNPLYSVSYDYHSFTKARIIENSYGIKNEGNMLLQKLFNAYSYGMYEVFAQLFMYPAFIHLFLVVSVLAKFKFNRFGNWKKILLILPVFIYNFGSMLLLTSWHDCSRFFYYTFLILPVLGALIYRKDKIEEALQ